MINNVLDIILVEDNPADIEMTMEAFREYNLANRVKILKDGAEALEYIFRQGEYNGCGICEHPALILLDVHLPKIDGMDILRKIREDERTRLLPVVIMTSSPSDQDRLESYKLGVNSYITKPIEFDAFAKIVSQIGFYWAVLNEPPRQ